MLYGQVDTHGNKLFNTVNCQMAVSIGEAGNKDTVAAYVAII